MLTLGGKKRGFTLAEVVIVCSLFAVIVVGIILLINRAFVFMDNTRLSVRAANFAREGVEMVYNIRDTNRKKCSGSRDNFWLYLGSGAGENNEKKCNPRSNLLTGGIYVIKEGNFSGDKIVYAENLGINVNDIDNFYSTEGFFSDAYSGKIINSKIVFTGSYSYYSGGTLATGNLEDLVTVNGLEFYRILRVYGVYKKNNSSPLDRLIDNYQDSNPKELRFCVKVFYRGNGKHESELCSIMTNFME